MAAFLGDPSAPLSLVVMRQTHKTPKEILTLLKSLGTDNIRHHGRKLIQHLMGTHDLLRKWGSEPSVTNAGLLHSVYGTEEFRRITVPISDRRRIVELIGEESEQLVYLFCIADRRSLWNLFEGDEVYVLAPALDNLKIDISRLTYTQLLEIEVANIVDQALNQKGVAQKHIDYWIQTFEQNNQFISDAATDAYRSVLHSYGA